MAWNLIWLRINFPQIYYGPLRNNERSKQTFPDIQNPAQIFFWTHWTQQHCVVVASLSLISACITCVSADFGWRACCCRKRLSVAEPACFRVDQSAGLPLADGHEYGPVHARIHSKGRGRPAALASGQWQVKGESTSQVSPVFTWNHAELPAKSFSLNPFHISLQALGVSSQSDRSIIKKKLKDLRKAQEKLEKQREKKEKEGRRSGRLPLSTDSVCWGTPRNTRSNLVCLYFWDQAVSVAQHQRWEHPRHHCIENVLMGFSS